jgi:excisionase family DNA binding protein
MRLITEKQVIELLGVGRKTLYRWRTEGRIPFVRLPGGMIRYRQNALDRWVRRGCPLPRASRDVSSAGKDTARS